MGSHDNLRGRVWHVEPGRYGVAVYIKVGGGWWTKPYFNAPVTEIGCDGTWVCDITAGGADQTETEIAAFLIPIAYAPPLSVSLAALPAELYANSPAFVAATRD